MEECKKDYYINKIIEISEQKGREIKALEMKNSNLEKENKELTEKFNLINEKYELILKMPI